MIEMTNKAKCKTGYVQHKERDAAEDEESKLCNNKLQTLTAIGL
jgi:hypothetical protein